MKNGGKVEVINPRVEGLSGIASVLRRVAAKPLRVSRAAY